MDAEEIKRLMAASSPAERLKLINTMLDDRSSREILASFLIQDLDDIYQTRAAHSGFRYSRRETGNNLFRSIRKRDVSPGPYLRQLPYAALLILAMTLGFTARSFFRHEQERVASSMIRYSVPMGSRSHIELPDGSQVWLNSGSTLRCPANFSATKREVFLSGEAFFEVEHNAKRPFMVNTDLIRIDVLGTAFNVKAYPDEDIIETSVRSGKVKVLPVGDQEQYQSPVILTRDHQLRVHRDKPDLNKMIPLNEDESPERKTEKLEPVRISRLEIERPGQPEQIFSWVENRLVFQSQKLSDLSSRMARWYNARIEIRDSSLKEVRFTGAFENETLGQALEALSVAEPFYYLIRKDRVVIDSKPIGEKTRIQNDIIKENNNPYTTN